MISDPFGRVWISALATTITQEQVDAIECQKLERNSSIPFLHVGEETREGGFKSQEGLDSSSRVMPLPGAFFFLFLGIMGH